MDWDQASEERLWKLLKESSTEIDWTEVAARFNVSVLYILQQAAWLYEKELRLLRERMTLINLPKPTPHVTPQKLEQPLQAAGSLSSNSLHEADFSNRRLLSQSRFADSDSDSASSMEGFVLQ